MAEVYRNIRKAIANLSDEFDGIQLSPDYEMGGPSEPFYIIWKTFTSDETINGKQLVKVVYFDREDLENDNIHLKDVSEYDIKKYGSVKAAAAQETAEYIERNFRGYNMNNMDIDPIEESLLVEFQKNPTIISNLYDYENELYDDTKAQKQPVETIQQLKKNLHGDEQLNAVLKHMKKLSSDLNLGEPIIVNAHDYDGMPYHSWGVEFYYEGFTFAWEYQSGWYNLTIYRNNQKIINTLSYNKGKDFHMGSSPKYFTNANAYECYYRFAAKVLDRIKGTWKVSLDDEE